MSSFIPEEDRQAVTPSTLRQPSPQSVSAPMEINAFDGSTRVRSSSSIQTGDGTYGADLASNQYDRIVATAKSATGAPIGYRRELRDDDVVSIHGMDVQVKVARTMGLLDHGNKPMPRAIDRLIEPEEAPMETSDATSSEQALEPMSEALLAHMVQHTSNDDQVTALHEVIEVGDVSLGTLERLASSSGTEPEKVAAQIAKVRGAFENQAVQAVAQVGVPDTEDFFEWAYSTRPQDMKAAIRDHAMQRTTSAYQSLAKAYLEDLDTRMPQELLEADYGPGVTTRLVNGRVILNIPGRGEVSWKVAVKSGLIGKPQRVFFR